jgi:hypothetical protein
MIIKRAVLKAALAVTTQNEKGYTLSSIQIRPDGTVAATNGSAALIVTDREPFTEEDFPRSDGDGGGRVAPFTGNPTTPILLEAAQALQLIKIMPTKARIPILAAVQLSTNGAEGGAVCSATDLSAAVVVHVTAEQNGGRFPSLDKVWPAVDRPEVSVCLSVTMLQDLIAAAKAIESAHITFGIPPNDVSAERAVTSVIRITVGGSRSRISIEGVAMPCRL